MSTVGVVVGRMSTTCVADTVVVRIVVGMMSWTSGGTNGGFASNSDAKGVEVVCMCHDAVLEVIVVLVALMVVRCPELHKLSCSGLCLVVVEEEAIVVVVYVHLKGLCINIHIRKVLGSMQRFPES